MRKSDIKKRGRIMKFKKLEAVISKIENQIAPLEAEAKKVESQIKDLESKLIEDPGSFEIAKKNRDVKDELDYWKETYKNLSDRIREIKASSSEEWIRELGKTIDQEVDEANAKFEERLKSEIIEPVKLLLDKAKGLRDEASEHQEALSTLSRKVTHFLDLNVGNASNSYRYSILFANKISATPWSLLKELLGNAENEWSVIDD